MMRIFRISMSVAIAFCLLPAAAVILSALVAGYAGCQLDEGGAHPCIIGGHDYGETLVTMFVSGWFALLTAPILLVLVPIWIIREILHWRRGRDKASADA